jgi:DNA-binding transcriptional regulator GbsR (MarR family)
MIKVLNIVSNRDLGGAFYSDSITGFHPSSHTLPLEPWIGDRQLRLDEQMMIHEDFYELRKDYLESLAKNRIIKLVFPLDKAKNAKEFSESFKETISSLKEVANELKENIDTVSEELLADEKVKHEVEALPEMLKNNEELVNILEKQIDMVEEKNAPDEIKVVKTPKVTIGKKKK